MRRAVILEFTCPDDDLSMMQLFSILFNSQLFVNTFTLTFIAEWGDRSQLATIVLAGINDVVRNKIVAGWISECFCAHQFDI